MSPSPSTALPVLHLVGGGEVTALGYAARVGLHLVALGVVAALAYGAASVVSAVRRAVPADADGDATDG